MFKFKAVLVILRNGTSGEPDGILNELIKMSDSEKLSPLLFALFISKIEDDLLKNSCSYVNIYNEALDNYFKLLVKSMLMILF